MARYAILTNRKRRRREWDRGRGKTRGGA